MGFFLLNWPNIIFLFFGGPLDEIFFGDPQNNFFSTRTLPPPDDLWSIPYVFPPQLWVHGFLHCIFSILCYGVIKFLSVSFLTTGSPWVTVNQLYFMYDLISDIWPKNTVGLIFHFFVMSLHTTLQSYIFVGANLFLTGSVTIKIAYPPFLSDKSYFPTPHFLSCHYTLQDPSFYNYVY